MARKVKTKTAIVTGASKGLGLRIAKTLAKKKYNVAICSRHLDELKRAKKIIESYGVKCLALKTDVSNYNQCKSLVKKTIRTFSRIDLLVNNAGIIGPIGNLWKNNLKDWENTIKINLLGTVNMCHLVVPYMLKQKNGIIINLSGGGGAYGRPLFGAYACSKTTVLRLTETLADELKGTNINIFALAPGATWTEMAKETLKKGKLDKKNVKELKAIQKTGGTPVEKLEKLVLFLVSKRAKKLSGKLVHVQELNKITKRITGITQESGLLRRVNYI